MSIKYYLLALSVLLLSACGGDDDDDGDTSAPTYDSSIPEHMEEGVDVETAITIFFNEPIRDNTVSNDSIALTNVGTGEVISGEAEVRGSAILFAPDQKLAFSTEYRIESDFSIEDGAGNIIEEPVDFYFTTEAIYIPTPEVTYKTSDSTEEAPVAPSGEIYLPVSAERAALHAENHSFPPVITATLPAIFDVPAMDSVEDFALRRDEDLVVINPAPNEFLWIMEGKRHGYDHMSAVFTHTPPGNGAPLHTHVGQEAHILLEGEMRYFLGDEEFTLEAPYIVNIPSMVPHAFMNIHDEPVNLVGIFMDSDSWEYDVLASDIFFPIEGGPPEKTGLDSENAQEWLKQWHSPESQQARLKAYREQQ